MTEMRCGQDDVKADQRSVFSRVPSAGFEPAHTAPEADALSGIRAVKALFGRCTPFVYELFAVRWFWLSEPQCSETLDLMPVGDARMQIVMTRIW